MDANQINFWISINAENFAPEALPVVKGKLEQMDDTQMIFFQTVSFKKPSTILLIAIFLGWERFLLGSIGLGILKVITGYGCGIWWLIDVFTAKKRARKYNFKQFQKLTLFVGDGARDLDVVIGDPIPEEVQQTITKIEQHEFGTAITTPRNKGLSDGKIALIIFVVVMQAVGLLVYINWDTLSNWEPLCKLLGKANWPDIPESPLNGVWNGTLNDEAATFEFVSIDAVKGMRGIVNARICFPMNRNDTMQLSGMIDDFSINLQGENSKYWGTLQKDSSFFSGKFLDVNTGRMSDFSFRNPNKKTDENPQLSQNGATDSKMNATVYIDSLNQLILALRSENAELTQKLAAERSQRTRLTEDSKKMTTNVQKIQILLVADILTTGLTSNNRREVITDHVRTVDKLKTCFTVRENQVIAAGERTLYVVIIKPDKKVLLNNVNDTFTTQEGGEIVYTDKRIIDYENKDIEVCIFTGNDSRLTAGNYEVNVYCDGYLAGTSTFVPR